MSSHYQNMVSSNIRIALVSEVGNGLQLLLFLAITDIILLLITISLAIINLIFIL